MKHNKIWCTLTLCLTLCVLILVGTITAVIDPLFHYHAPLNSLQYPLHSQRYQNDGIVRHFDYDALITGSSMTENFRNSEFDALFGVHSVKVSYSGAAYAELVRTLEQAIRHNPKLKLVVFGMDERFLLNEQSMILAKGEYPSYLYDDNIFNDVYYLANREIFWGHTLKVLNHTRSGQATTSFDDYSAWAHLVTFGTDVVLEKYDRPEQREQQRRTDVQCQKLEETLQQSILKIAEENPEIQFVYFIPPFSILSWDAHQRQGDLECQVEAFEQTSELLLEMENIQFYSFCTDFDTITNLNNYKDITHYGPEINSLILECIHSGEYRLTKENYQEHWAQVREFYMNYDYDAIFDSSDDEDESDF